VDFRGCPVSRNCVSFLPRGELRRCSGYFRLWPGPAVSRLRLSPVRKFYTVRHELRPECPELAGCCRKRNPGRVGIVKPLGEGWRRRSNQGGLARITLRNSGEIMCATTPLGVAPMAMLQRPSPKASSFRLFLSHGETARKSRFGFAPTATSPFHTCAGSSVR
jgi:hypothetical protein